MGLDAFTTHIVVGLLPDSGCMVFLFYLPVYCISANDIFSVSCCLFVNLEYVM